MAVFINGTEYTPKTDEFRLTEAHFEAASKTANAFDAIRWVHQNQASVSEMVAWLNAVASEPIEEAKLPPNKKRAPALF